MNNEIYEKTLSGIEEGVVIFKAIASGKFLTVFANRAFFNNTSLTKEEVIGKELKTYVLSQAFKNFNEHFKEALRSGRDVQFESNYVSPEGRKYFKNRTFLLDSHSNESLLVLASREITNYVEILSLLSDKDEYINYLESRIDSYKGIIKNIHSESPTENVEITLRHPQMYDLSDREKEVMRHLMNGLGVKRIAEAMGLSSKTISTYKARLLKKMNVKTTIELIHLIGN